MPACLNPFHIFLQAAARCPIQNPMSFPLTSTLGPALCQELQANARLRIRQLPSQPHPCTQTARLSQYVTNTTPSLPDSTKQNHHESQIDNFGLQATARLKARHSLGRKPPSHLYVHIYALIDTCRLVQATARLKARQLPGRKPYFNTGESPDLWFEPGEVWEIRGADLTISPVHMSAVGRLHPSRGVSMRYTRFSPPTHCVLP